MLLYVCILVLPSATDYFFYSILQKIRMRTWSFCRWCISRFLKMYWEKDYLIRSKVAKKTKYYTTTFVFTTWGIEVKVSEERTKCCQNCFNNLKVFQEKKIMFRNFMYLILSEKSSMFVQKLISNFRTIARIHTYLKKVPMQKIVNLVSVSSAKFSVLFWQ